MNNIKDIDKLYASALQSHKKFLKLDQQMESVQKKRDQAYREWVQAKDAIRFVKNDTEMTPLPDTPDLVRRVHVRSEKLLDNVLA